MGKLFRKNHEPWNKGLKGFGVEWLQEHQFQKGHLRYTAARKWRPVGTIVTWMMARKSIGRQTKTGRITKVPVKFIKWTDDPSVKASRRWKRLGVHIWEQANGPVPKGKVLVHLDQDLSNCDIDNLMAMTRAEMFAYLSARFPKYERSRTKAISRAKTGHRKVSVPNLTFHQCSQCAFEVQPLVTVCPKCNSNSIETLERSVSA
jgi:predicted Zn-ribbon and HTH transcriptional regulator